MRVCLLCLHAWKGDPIWCGHCKQRTFKGRYCGAKTPHLNPAFGARHCLTCGRTDLTQYAPSLSLLSLVRIIAWGLAILALRWLYHHAGEVACLMASAARLFAAWFLGIRPSCVDALLCRAMAWAVTLLILLWLIPGQTGKSVRGFVFGFLRRASGVLLALLRGAFRLVVLLVEGKKEPKSAQK